MMGTERVMSTRGKLTGRKVALIFLAFFGVRVKLELNLRYATSM